MFTTSAAMVIKQKLPADARPELLGSMQSVLQDKNVSTVKRLRQSKESSVARFPGKNCAVHHRHLKCTSCAVDCREAGCDAIVIEIMLHLASATPGSWPTCTHGVPWQGFRLILLTGNGSEFNDIIYVLCHGQAWTVIFRMANSNTKILPMASLGRWA